MGRIKRIEPDKATGKVKEIYESLTQKMGKVINIFQYMGQSEPVLEGFLALSKARSKTDFSPQMMEKIALVCAEENGCDYCFTSHKNMALSLKMSEKEIKEAAKAHSSDPKEKAILQFVKNIIKTRANISDTELETLKASGVLDKEIVEIHLVVMTNMFTNYFNHIVQTEIDT